MCADVHVDFLKFVLGVSDKDQSYMVALIGENANTIRAFVRLVGGMFIGYHSDKFNLAMKGMTLDLEDIIGEVHILMKKLSFSIPAALLRRHTPLASKRNSGTRWTKTFELLNRYCKLRKLLQNIDHSEVRELLLFAEDDARAHKL